MTYDVDPRRGGGAGLTETSVSAHYIDVADLAGPLADPLWPQRIGATFAMVGCGLPYAVRWQRRRAVSSAG